MTWTDKNSFKAHIVLFAGIWMLLTGAQAVVNLLGTDRLLEYRAWEAVITKGERRPFLPLTEWSGQATGDLVHMANVVQLERPRHQVFKTDEYGFRNPVGVLDQPVDVVILGDSFPAGSHLSEGETLVDLMRSELGLRVYNYSHANSSLLLGDTRFAGPKPRLVVMLLTEYFVPPPLDKRPDKALVWTPRRAESGSLQPHRYERRPILELYETARYVRPLTEPLYGGITWRFGLRSLPATIGHVDPATGMIFYREGIANALDPEGNKDRTDETIEFLDWFAYRIAGWGSRLLVVLAPSKESLYSDRVPDLAEVEPDAYHEYFLGELAARGVGHLRTAALFRVFRERYPDDDLYFTDDTHMTMVGQHVLLHALTPVFREAGLLPKTPN